MTDCEPVIEAANRAISDQGTVISLQSDEIARLRFNYDFVTQELDAQADWKSQATLIVVAAFLGGLFAAGYMSGR